MVTRKIRMESEYSDLGNDLFKLHTLLKRSLQNLQTAEFMFVVEVTKKRKTQKGGTLIKNSDMRLMMMMIGRESAETGYTDQLAHRPDIPADQTGYSGKPTGYTELLLRWRG